MSKALIGAAELGAAVADGAAMFVMASTGVGLAALPYMMHAMEALVVAGVSMEAGAIADALTSNRGMGITTRQPAAFRQIVYGEQRIGGVTIYESTTGSEHDQYNYVIVLATHEIDSILGLYLDGRKVYFEGSGGGWSISPGGVGFGGNANSTTYTGPNGQQYNFGGLVYCEARYGNQLSGDVISGLTANDGHWVAGTNGSPYVGGCAYVYLKVEYDPSMFPQPPEIKFTVRGKNNIYDPRTSTSGYSTNWALVVADVLTDTTWGVGDAVNEAQLIAAANVCDEQIDLAAGLIAATAGEIIAVPGDGGIAFGSTAPTATITINGDGTGAIATPVITEVTTNTWVMTGVTITNPGSGYTYATATLETSGWSTPPSLGPVQISTGESSSLTESQYTCCWHYDTNTSPADVLETMMSAAMGRISKVGGEWYIFPAYWQGPSFSFDENALVGSISWLPNRSVTELSNRVTGTYTAANYPYNVAGDLYDSHGWYDGTIQNNFPFAFQPTSYPQYACDQLHGYGDGIDVYLTADGGIPHPMELAQPCVLSVSQAQRCAKIALMRNRQQGSGLFPMSLSAWQMQPMDVMQFTMSSQSWVNKYLELTSLRFRCEEAKDGNGRPVRRLYVQASVQETDPSVYEWEMSEELSVYDVPAAATAIPYIVSAPTSLTITDDTSTQMVLQDGSTTPRMLVQWAPPTDTYVANGGCIQVQYQLNTSSGASEPTLWGATPTLVGGVWQSQWMDAGSVSGISTSMYIAGINSSQFENISVQIRAVRANGAASAWVEVSNHTLLHTQPAFHIGSTGGGAGGGPILSFTSGATLDTLEPAESNADSTANRLALTSGLFPSASASVSAGTSSVLGSSMVVSSSTSDVFLVLAQIASPSTGALSGVMVQVDGAGNYGFTNGAGALIAAVSGLAAGSHTIQVVVSVPGGTGEVTSIPVTYNGIYTTATPPTVNISGDGSGATATAIMNEGYSGGTSYWTVAYINVTDGGTGYTTATATLSGGTTSGSPATLGTPVIGGTSTTATWSLGTCQLIVQQVLAAQTAGFNTAPPRTGGTILARPVIT